MEKAREADMNAEKRAPNVTLESNWGSEADLQNCLSLRESGAPHLVPEDDFVSVQSSALLRNEHSDSSSPSQSVCLPSTDSSQLSKSTSFELRLTVPDEDCAVTGFAVVSEAPMFELYSGVHYEYMGTFSGYVMDETLDIVTYRVDIQPRIKIRNKAVLKFSPKPGRHSMWVFGVVVLYEKIPSEMMNAGPIDLNHVVSLVANARGKPTTETDLSLMTKLCEIFNSSMSSANGGGDHRLLRPKCKESVARQSPAFVTENCDSREEAKASGSSQNGIDLAGDLVAFKEKVESSLTEHSERLAVVAEAFLSKSRTIATAAGDHSHQNGSGPSMQQPGTSSGGVQELAKELRTFKDEVRQRFESLDSKLDAILGLLQQSNNEQRS